MPDDINGDVSSKDKEPLEKVSKETPDEGEEVLEAIEGLRKEVGDSTAFAKVISIPEVRQLLLAKDEGKNVRVVVGDEVNNEEPVIPEEDIDEMSNSQFLGLLEKKLPSLISGVVREEVKEDRELLRGLAGRTQDEMQKDINRQVKVVSQKYPDFKKYSDDVLQLSDEHPNSSIEELYVLARMRKGDGLPPVVDKTDSERPTPSPARGGVRKERKTFTDVGSGSQGFKELVGRGIKSVREREGW